MLSSYSNKDQAEGRKYLERYLRDPSYNHRTEVKL